MGYLVFRMEISVHLLLPNFAGRVMTKILFFYEKFLSPPFFFFSVQVIFLEY